MGSSRGFTLIELLVVMVLISVLASIALPTYRDLRIRAEIANAVGEVAAVQQEINEFRIINNRLPNDLAEIGRDAERDPWGRTYLYLRHDVAAEAEKRKDRFLVNVNTDFDLYSLGPDGTSAPAFTDSTAWDDIVRANDGGFIGLAEVF